MKFEKYTSCKWLESGICFDNGVYGSNVKLCCYMSAPGGGNSMIFENYKGEKINWEEFFRIKDEYRKIQKSGGTVPGCRGCVFLEEKEWLQENYIDNLLFDHFTKCSCRCIYCYTEEDKKRYNTLKTYNVYPVVKDMFDKGIIRKGGAIGFGGGEPVMLKEFDKLIKLFLKNGFTDMRVPSCAMQYSKAIEEGIKSGQLSIVVSLDSGTSETYKKIKQVDAFGTVCRNLKRYSKAQKNSWNVICKYIIIPGINDRKAEIDAWLQFCIDNKIMAAVIDIENSALERYRQTGIDKRIINIIKYVKMQTYKLGFSRLEICDRAEYLLGRQE